VSDVTLLFQNVRRLVHTYVKVDVRCKALIYLVKNWAKVTLTVYTIKQR
jgi:hypothetical protein